MKILTFIIKLFFWILGIFIALLGITAIFSDSLIAGLFLLLAGLSCLPVLNKFLLKKLDKTKAASLQLIFFSLLLIAFILSLPSQTTSEKNTNKPAPQISENNAENTNTAEYKKYSDFVKKEEQREKQKSEKEKQIKIESQKMIKQYKQELKASLDKVVAEYDIQEYEYTYYVNDSTWIYSNYKEKESFFNMCAQYGGLYMNDKGKTLEYLLARTKIKSYNNGEVLGEYGIFNGYKFK